MELYNMAIQNTGSIFGTISHRIQAQSKPLSIIFLFALVLAAFSFAYKMWSAKKERAAQYDFSALMTEYETMLQDQNPEWDTLLKKFEKNYEKHSGSSLLPYYLSYKVKILLNQDKKEEALTELNKIITDIPGSPLLSLYQMEYALIQLDSNDNAVKTVGLDALRNLATDMNNKNRDSAQFYLGRYYWAMNDIDAARNVWQQLVDEQHDEKLAPSPWVSFVQDKLNITIV
jgi:predicted negative regulator of RcsB-dependent stress response